MLTAAELLLERPVPVVRCAVRLVCAEGVDEESPAARKGRLRRERRWASGMVPRSSTLRRLGMDRV